MMSYRLHIMYVLKNVINLYMECKMAKTEVNLKENANLSDDEPF